MITYAVALTIFLSGFLARACRVISAYCEPAEWTEWFAKISIESSFAVFYRFVACFFLVAVASASIAPVATIFKAVFLYAAYSGHALPLKAVRAWHCGN
jgi:hypothetical protein